MAVPMKGWDLIAENYGPPKPLTLEALQQAWDDMGERVKNAPWQKPMRIVSHEVYKRAEEAIADGAGGFEVDLILCGYSRELARKTANDRGL